MKTVEKTRLLSRRHRRVRKKVSGTAERPRLAVYRSNRHIYAQLINDTDGRTIVAASTVQDSGKGEPREKAKNVGKTLADRAKAAGIEQVTFDRGGFKYHGRVAALADGAREGGLEF